MMDNLTVGGMYEEMKRSAANKARRSTDIMIKRAEHTLYTEGK